MIRLAALILSVFVCTISHFGQALAAETTDIGNQFHWQFFSDSSSKGIPIDVGTGSLAEILPARIPCCNGHYQTDVKLTVLGLSATRGESLSILVPATGGLKSVVINNLVTELPNRDYTSTGTLIPIPPAALSQEDLKLTIYVNGPVSAYSGMWKDSPSIGNTTALLRKHDLRTIIQYFVPLILFILFFFISVIFIWLKIATNTRDPVYREFIFTLFFWSIFYLFLSGTVREWIPRWGADLHLPLRGLVSIATFRLLGAFSGIDPRAINRVTLLLMPILGIQVLASVEHHLYIVNILYCVLNFPGVVATVILVRNSKTVLMRIIAVLAVIAAIGYLCDSLKLVSTFLGFRDELIFFNRYTTPPFLFTSLIYLAYSLSYEMGLSIKKRAFQDAAAQFVHDIQSPLVALEMVGRGALESSEERSRIAEQAIARIRAVCASLKNFERKQEIKPLEITAALDALLKEKRSQFKSKNGNPDSNVGTKTGVQVTRKC